MFATKYARMHHFGRTLLVPKTAFNFRPNWASAKSLMADVNFLKRLFTYDKEHIPEATIKKLKKYIEHKDFIPAVMPPKIPIS